MLIILTHARRIICLWAREIIVKAQFASRTQSIETNLRHWPKVSQIVYLYTCAMVSTAVPPEVSTQGICSRQPSSIVNLPFRVWFRHCARQIFMFTTSKSPGSVDLSCHCSSLRLQNTMENKRYKEKNNSCRNTCVKKYWDRH